MVPLKRQVDFFDFFTLRTELASSSRARAESLAAVWCWLLAAPPGPALNYPDDSYRE